ncbi:nitrate reductase molybdenum cofactor assembly chaperone [Oricola sp.]|uniref:nitrate reductase molybdenum cofactor assembly chaperone n=1 Tax=Oricola sp. TaxID=1979950 RepID=UPI0025F8F853|nr:nitrate reductase molybdenum cofactor assembly chaperone [Oricola sp.]MCI5073989.1 nitrate reductase molybdenum cofactor assembly chaperone [Oricola sp.]
MNTALKVISLLLTYPSEDIRAAIPELKAALDSAAIGEREAEALKRLADDIAGLDLYDAQERYVFLFDRTRSLSLHLFEHVHGEGRDRGQAMVDLMAMYEKDGFEIDAKELPDYLPMFLEYLSMKPADEAGELLGQTAHIFAALRERLKKRKSVYVNAFGVLEALALGKPDAALLAELLDMQEDNPDDLEALDRVWEEEAVTFGGNAGENACGPDRLQRQIRASHRKPADMAQAPNA